MRATMLPTVQWKRQFTLQNQYQNKHRTKLKSLPLHVEQWFKQFVVPTNPDRISCLQVDVNM